MMSWSDAPYFRLGFLVVIVFVFISGCLLRDAPPILPVITESEKAEIPETPKLTLTPTTNPTSTAAPEPTQTLLPTIAPSPTSTPIFKTEPVIADLSWDIENGRPNLSGTVRFVDTEYFRIFYTLSGIDAVKISDENGNAIPDYVEEMAGILTFVWKVEIDEFGWQVPPDDQDLGGDERFDIYLKHLPKGYLGITIGDQVNRQSGEISVLDKKDKRVLSSYMVIENDYKEYMTIIQERAEEDSRNLDQVDLDGLVDDTLRATIAHEFMHMIQYGYDAYEPDSWLWEASATWIESIVYPEIDLTSFELDVAFTAPDICQMAYGNGESSGHWYSEWLFLYFLTNKYDESLVRLIWEHAADHDGYAPLIYALDNYDARLDEEIRNYHVAMLLRDFDIDLDDHVVRLEGVVERPMTFLPATGVGQMGADYIQLDVDGYVEIYLHQLNQGVVIGIKDDIAELYALHDSSITVDADRYDELYLIVLNLDRARSIYYCAYSPYQVSVSISEGFDTPTEAQLITNFLTPGGESFSP